MRVLLTNDDGPPDSKHSPFIYGLYKLLTNRFGWEVKVVVPNSQKSWISSAYEITRTIEGCYYYPKDPDGLGESSPTSRPLKEGEVGEWILLNGTPATCTNIGLHNLYPGEIDLVISGPNFGRNTSTAFALASGTLGAALSASLSRKRAIAISYGIVLHPSPPELQHPAHDLTLQIIQYLLQNWGLDPQGPRNGEVDLYSINIPLIHKLLSDDGMRVLWTTMWNNSNSFGRLFKLQLAVNQGVPPAGPDADTHSSNASVHGQATSKNPLTFRFSPDMGPLIKPGPNTLPIGTDAWALDQGHASITALRAAFAEVDSAEDVSPRFDGEISEDKFLKLKL